jgi:hypothetical protein
MKTSEKESTNFQKTSDERYNEMLKLHQSLDDKLGIILSTQESYQSSNKKSDKNNPKKIGYKKFEELLVLAHKKSEILAQNLQALQSYITGYVEYQDNTDQYNVWINQRIIEEQDKLEKEKEQTSEKV